MDIPGVFLSDARRAVAREIHHGDAHVFGPEPARSSGSVPDGTAGAAGWDARWGYPGDAAAQL